LDLIYERWTSPKWSHGTNATTSNLDASICVGLSKILKIRERTGWSLKREIDYPFFNRATVTLRLSRLDGPGGKT
jgi:hypothetical protein